MSEKQPNPEKKDALGEGISACLALIESSTLDDETKRKLGEIIQDAVGIMGKPGTGAEHDKIGERLVAQQFVYELTHQKASEDAEEMRALVTTLSAELNCLHRQLLSEVMEKYYSQ